MINYRTKKSAMILAATLALTTLVSTADVTAKTAKVTTANVDLRIMETTDIHTNLMNYDYFKDAGTESVGLVKTATLVKEARKESKNTVLVDNGDTIQGTPLGTYKAKVATIKKGEIHPSIAAMNEMNYDVATFGNHEFNYGLSYLTEVYNDAKFKRVNANVYVDDKDKNDKNDKNKFTPYTIVNKTVKDAKGKTHKLKIGYIGFVAPQIMNWDETNLTGKVKAKDIVATAKKYVPEMKKKGADVVIAMAHSGFNADLKNNEDVVYSLTKVKDIDAVTFSHTHKIFPAKDVASLDSMFKDANGKVLKGINNKKGTINGVAAVQAGYGGAELGIIDMKLTKTKGKWKVKSTQSFTRNAKDKKPTKTVVNAVKKAHEGTLGYVNTPIGTTTDNIHSFFSIVKDDPSVQVVTNAQKWFMEKTLATDPELSKLPILSAGAPFKAGRNGPEEYTEIKKGDLTIRSAADLYLYDNVIKAVKVDGATVKEWLERSAGQFNQIDPKATTEQALINSKFRPYNFDVIDGVEYKVDVTQPSKYDPDGVLINKDAQRITELTYNGQAIDPKQEFIVVTNNYRATGGGSFPGVTSDKIVYNGQDENRQILMDYITEQKEIVPTVDNNWSIASIAGTPNVTFTSSPQGANYLTEESPYKYTGKMDADGFGIYTIDLSK
ncbi:MAG: bifunctional 2',3'-cyclic-nucleotide 2'-phosphodiesterase/3'-nucleotidase [Kurthia sp.]|nr:bifunctional 2',3'-cyclic-nucleotide 2'-phosphodiesterase/3'-nucleotidase [Candidatus Kurthia equi]